MATLDGSALLWFSFQPQGDVESKTMLPSSTVMERGERGEVTEIRVMRCWPACAA